MYQYQVGSDREAGYCTGEAIEKGGCALQSKPRQTPSNTLAFPLGLLIHPWIRPLLWVPCQGCASLFVGIFSGFYPLSARDDPDGSHSAERFVDDD